MTPIPAGGAKAPLTVILALGTAQTIAWASSYYIPAILAAPLAIGLMVEHIGSGALWVSALASLSAFMSLLLLHAKRSA